VARPKHHCGRFVTASANMGQVLQSRIARQCKT
jgi:hypothetical protein